MKQIIKGDDLMLFDENGKSLAFATSHVLTLTANTVDITTKDGGIWGASDVNKLTWELTTENLYTEECFDKLYDIWISRGTIIVYFGMKKETDPEKTVADGDYENWSGAAGKYGRAVITSLTANANTGENATYSATFTGKGKLQKTETIPAAASGTSMASVQSKALKA